MPDYRRFHREGGTFFFTVVTHRRQRILSDPSARRWLRDAITQTRRQLPFQIDAWVVLPDHLHTIWTLPRGDTDYSARWALIKSRFTHAWIASGQVESPVSESQQRRRRRRRGVWQPRFFEHTIRDERDFERHFDYVHYNPVKHGLVSCPSQWLFSTFHRYTRMGWYPPDWCCPNQVASLPPDFSGVVGAE